MSSVVRPCAGCGEPLPDKHLRVQLAPPDSKWHEVRVHDAICLDDWVGDELAKLESGQETLFGTAGMRVKMDLSP